jgi:predicted Zn-dependent protease
MSKVGRNDPCPCGSGKKFKRCCQERVEAGKREAHRHAEVERLAAERARLEAERDFAERKQEDALHDSETFTRVDYLSESVLASIGSGRLDDAETTARQLLAEFPDDPLGTERLGEVFEARGNVQAAAEEYRRGVAMMDVAGEGHYCDCCRARMVKAVRRVDPSRPAPAMLCDPR